MKHVRNLLVVDPLKETGEVLESALAARGLRVVAAESSDEGLELARSEHPELIVLDIDAAPLDHSRWDAEIERSASDHSTPIVVLGTLRRHAERLPSGRFVQKPYHYAALVRTIETLLDRQRSNRPTAA